MQRKLDYANKSKRKFSLEDGCKACQVQENFAGNFKHDKTKATIPLKDPYYSQRTNGKWMEKFPISQDISLVSIHWYSFGRTLLGSETIPLCSQRFHNWQKFDNLTTRQMTAEASGTWGCRWNHLQRLLFPYNNHPVAWVLKNFIYKDGFAEKKVTYLKNTKNLLWSNNIDNTERMNIESCCRPRWPLRGLYTIQKSMQIGW